jgi:hypothetical protein
LFEFQYVLGSITRDARDLKKEDASEHERDEMQVARRRRVVFSGA